MLVIITSNHVFVCKHYAVSVFSVGIHRTYVCLNPNVIFSSQYNAYHNSYFNIEQMQC